MTRILLAEHSPHAQRMGERILRDEGYQVVTVSDGETAMLRLKDVKPQLVLADISLAGYSGFALCDFLKSTPEFAGTRVVLTVGALESPGEQELTAAKADGMLRKPFEASALLDLVSRICGAAAPAPTFVDRTGDFIPRPTRSVVVLDPDQVRAAVTVALEEAMDPLITRVTERVLAALSRK